MIRKQFNTAKILRKDENFFKTLGSSILDQQILTEPGVYTSDIIGGITQLFRPGFSKT